MTIKELCNYAKDKIGYLDAKILMTHLLNKDIQYIISNADEELSEEQENKYLEEVKKIEKGYPLQYVTNKQEFMRLKFFVNDNVLIPQPDTEVLVEEAMERAEKIKNCKILDLQTKSNKDYQILSFLPTYARAHTCNSRFRFLNHFDSLLLSTYSLLWQLLQL